MPKERRQPSGFITVRGACENNLKNIDVKIPLGIMTCVTGVSGSGKSSLVNEILYKALAKKLNRARTIPGKHKCIEGVEQLDKIMLLISLLLEGPLVQIRLLIPEFLILFVNCSARQMKQNCAVISQGASALMLKAERCEA